MDTLLGWDLWWTLNPHSQIVKLSEVSTVVYSCCWKQPLVLLHGCSAAGVCCVHDSVLILVLCCLQTPPNGEVQTTERPALLTVHFWFCFFFLYKLEQKGTNTVSTSFC